MTRILITALAGFGLTGIIGYLLLPALRALKAGQSIREVGPTWHNSKAGTPMMGGLMFILALVLCILGNIPAVADSSLYYVLLLSLAFGLIGFLDDFTKAKFKRNLGLTSIQKALLQMAVSLLFLYAIYRHGAMTCSLYIPFFNVSFHIPPVVYILIATFVMVGCVNAVTLTDGVDGLCASVTIPVMIFFTAASVSMKRMDLALFPAALVGGLACYLFYNWHPAKVFMGDTGSLFLGGAVCALAFALDIPLILVLVGLIYVIETLSVILQVAYFKATHGKRLFKMAPIHHHFEMSGWKEEKIVLTFAAVTVVMCILAWIGIAGLRAPI